ncbi:MAG: hypothetical protein ABI635_11810 [Actinomycetota bacterium]
MAAKIDRDAAGRIARRKAKAALAKAHPDEYRALIAESLAALGHGHEKIAAAKKATARKSRTAKK